MTRGTQPQQSEATAAVPSAHHSDPVGLRQFLETMYKQGSWIAVLTWVIEFATSLWKVQQSMLAKDASRKRSKPPSERSSVMSRTLPGFEDSIPPHESNQSELELEALKQQKLDAQDEQHNQSNDGSAAEPKKKKKKRKPGTGRPILPARLVRVEQAPILVPEQDRTCPSCSESMSTCEFKRTEKLELVPAHHVVLVITREVCRCDTCFGKKVVVPMPPEIVKRGILGDELIVNSLVDHYLHHTAFHQMEAEANNQGVPLKATTLARSVAAAIELFEPVVKYIAQRCVASHVMGADAATAPVLDVKHPEGIRSGMLWNFVGDGAWSYFSFAPTGHSYHLEQLFEGQQLEVLLCDGSPTLNVVERQSAARAGCVAHARRRFVDAVKKGDLRAVVPISYFMRLFAVEVASKAMEETPEQRLIRRQRDSAPIVEQLKQWRDQLAKGSEPRSVLGEALRYLTRQWDRLMLFLTDGRVELTNNQVESQLRTWVLDRKVWLFFGHDKSGRLAAMALTVLMTAKLQGINVRAYMRDTQKRLLAGETDGAALSPEQYRLAHPA